MTAKEHDIVQLKNGRTATVLEVFETDVAYLVEVSDESGKSLSMSTVAASDIEKVVWKA